MSDLESRLTQALDDGAQHAPSARSLAEGARSRARSRRRSRTAGAVAAAALVVGVPTAVVLVGGSNGDPSRDPAHNRVATDPTPSTDASQGSVPLKAGYHWESWHDVTVQVPDTWQYGALSDWCANGGALTPRIQRPETVAEAIGCEPGSTYGLSFQQIDNTDDFQWPTVAQSGGGWPEDNVVGGRGIGGVLIMVATPEADLDQALYIQSTMHAIGPTGDPNGCQSRYTPDSATPPEGGLSICRYDETGALEQSEALFGKDAGDAVRALQAAPEPGACADASQGSQPHEVVALQSAGISARVDLVNGCARVTVDGHVRELTSDVLYWALSPGWSGSVPDGVSLPSELRKE